MSGNSYRKTSMYKPLPSEVTVKESKIDGLGLFTTEPIEKEHVFGITHIQHDDFQHGYIRTPLGGFINHSEKPNCILINEGTSAWSYMKLKSLYFIREDEELTLTYSLYGIL